MRNLFRKSARVPSINWGEFILKVNEKFPVLNNKEQLVEAIISSCYEFLPLPIRLIVDKERFVLLITQNANILWETYTELKINKNE